MGSTNQVDVVVIQELRHHITSKNKTDPSFILTPATHPFFRVGPQQIAQKTLIRNLNRPDNFHDLLKGLKFRTEATVHAEDFFVDDGGNGENVKNVGENFPHFQIIFSFAWICEIIIHSS